MRALRAVLHRPAILRKTGVRKRVTQGADGIANREEAVLVGLERYFGLRRANAVGEVYRIAVPVCRNVQRIERTGSGVAFDHARPRAERWNGSLRRLCRRNRPSYHRLLIGE